MSEADLPKYEKEVLRRISDYFEPGVIKSITTGDNEMSEERILIFSSVYPEDHPMRYRVIDKQFLETCTDVDAWSPLSASLFSNTRTPLEYKYATFDDWLVELEDKGDSYDAEKSFTAARELKEK